MKYTIEELKKACNEATPATKWDTSTGSVGGNWYARGPEVDNERQAVKNRRFIKISRRAVPDLVRKLECTPHLAKFEAYEGVYLYARDMPGDDWKFIARWMKEKMDGHAKCLEGL